MQKGKAGSIVVYKIIRFGVLFPIDILSDIKGHGRDSFKKSCILLCDGPRYLITSLGP